MQPICKGEKNTEEGMPGGHMIEDNASKNNASEKWGDMFKREDAQTWASG